MVAVHVRDENEIDVGDRVGINRGGAAHQVRYTTAQERVGEHAPAVELDQHSRMTDESDPHSSIVPVHAHVGACGRLRIASRGSTIAVQEEV